MLQKSLLFKGFCLDLDVFCEGLEMTKNNKNGVTVCKFRVLAFWSWDCISGFIFAAEGFQNGAKLGAKTAQNETEGSKTVSKTIPKKHEKKAVKMFMQAIQDIRVIRPVVPLKNNNSADKQTPIQQTGRHQTVNPKTADRCHH